MKKIGIVTDSHGGISLEEANRIGVKILPMPFYIGGECYYENVSITREMLFERMAAGEKVSTSQPSPEEVLEMWREALDEFDEILYMPISSGLSGSCNTALMLAQDKEFAEKVFVVDNGRVSTPQHRAILDAVELIAEGYAAPQIKDMLENAKEQMSIYVTVENLEYLKKGGRISSTTAVVGTVLNIKPILSLGTQNLSVYKKCRGMKAARREMLEVLKTDIETRFKEAYANNEIYFMAASSADEQTTRQWVEEIKAYFPSVEVLCDPLSMGLSCHIGEGGLGVGCSCKPKR